ncbi:kinase-like domain-containing protein [Scheffersomyces amazonensis]|uniref:kinase-like domain-containing protein n=1 Tax=Scheffersomyces amazonensis TaxID=1078765 RepID=UPI00315DB590
MTANGLYQRTEVIGRGKFGIVYKGFNKQTKQVVAIKVLNLDTEEDEVADVQQEIQFLTELKNVPNVTHYYGSFLNDTKLWIIMDYCAGGSLRTLLKAGVFEERYVGIILRELLLGLSSVHKMGVIHRDLKAANVLITKEGKVQLCDFGVATKITSHALKRTTMAGTPYWMAPEVIRKGDTYNSKADIWSLGITIYEIATGNPPYCDRDADWAMQMISKSTPPRLEGREYSPALKECIALCLDENPDERPSADDLMKCKLVKLYKNLPRNTLKELISRYLLWRDKNPSRDSVYVQVEDRHENASIADVPQDIANDSSNQIQVKWDFDSLSSREYIIENDIHLEQETDNYDENDYTNNGGTDTYQTLPTLQASSQTISRINTVGLNNSSTTSLSNMTRSGNTTEIPKSLQSLFEDAEANEDSATNLPPPLSSMSSYTERVESPTIEIPDMDNLANFNTASTASLPYLNKPPPLYHSQSASASLESRFASSNANINTRQRKKTISNTFSSSTTAIPTQASLLQPQVQQQVQQQGQQQLPLRTPHTPPYTNHNIGIKTPSPIPPPSSSVLSNATIGATSGSPSKSMKALQVQTNPLLQPINFKVNSDGHATGSENNIKPVSSNLNNGNSASAKAKRARPGFHIQMPTPSNSINPLSALTNDANTTNGDDNINQFGINTAHAMPLAMTPVTEKEQPTFVTEGEQDYNGDNSHKILSKERSDSVASRHLPMQKTHKSSISAIGSGTNTANFYISRGNSISGTSDNAETITNTSSITFPIIPPINGEFFIDSTSKQKLVSELDNMIRLFNQGLEALELSL